MCSVGASWGHQGLCERLRLHHLWLSFPVASFFPSHELDLTRCLPLHPNPPVSS